MTDKLFNTKIRRYVWITKTIRAGVLPISSFIELWPIYKRLEIELLNQVSADIMHQVTVSINRDVIYTNQPCKTNSHFLVRPLAEKAFQIGGSSV